MEKKEALANYLGCEVDDIQEGYGDDIFEYGDQEYLVCDDYDDACRKSEESFLNLVDDLGGEMFSIKGLEGYINNNIDYDWFEDAFREDYGYYVDDIENESDDTYENRLIAEMVDDGILDEENDFHYAEDDEDQLSPLLNDDIDLDVKKEEFIDYLVGRIDDYVEEFRFQFGEDYLNKVVQENNLVDWEAIAEEVTRDNGPANELASYDGDEIELEDGYYAYRRN